MKKKSVVVLLTVTMVTEMTAAGCGDKQPEHGNSISEHDAKISCENVQNRNGKNCHAGCPYVILNICRNDAGFGV